MPPSSSRAGAGSRSRPSVKLVRRYWSLLDQHDRTVIISRERAYHGLAGYGTSIVGTDAFKVGVGPVAGDTMRVPWDSAEQLDPAIRSTGPERVAAFFCEPIIGAGGVLLPPDGYLQAARQVCRDHGVLFVADEVICGYGRVGTGSRALASSSTRTPSPSPRESPRATCRSAA